MPSSMTGYGRSDVTRDGRELVVELKSVNHRFLDIAFRMPRSFTFLENNIKAQLGDTLSRGHIDIFVTYDNEREDARKIVADHHLLGAYIRELRAAGEEYGLRDDVTLKDVLRMSDVLSIEEAQEDQAALERLMRDALAEALTMLTDMRKREGATLAADIGRKLDALETFANNVDARYPQYLEEYREKLRARVNELLAQEIDEARLAQEIALLADRAAVDEETVRLRSHIRQMRDMLGADASVGRKLDFIVQEMNREVNTIGSKSGDALLTNLVVDAKSEIEKVREQVQNIE